MPSRVIDVGQLGERSSSKRVRGWRGFGTICVELESRETTLNAGRRSAARSSSGEAPSEAALGLRLATLDDLQREPVVGVGSRRAGVVLRDRQARG